MDKDGEEKKAVKDTASDMMSKDELLQGMEKVDREIAQVKLQINNLKKMQVCASCGHRFKTCQVLRIFFVVPLDEHYIFLISLQSLTFTTFLYCLTN